MKFRTTWIIVIIAVLLGAYTYFVEYKGTEKKKQKEEQQKTLLQLKKDEVSEIRIRRGSENIQIAAGPGDTWQLTSPLKSRADEAAVSNLLAGFEKLQYKQVISEKSSDLATYGLDKPKAVLQFVLKKGGTKTVDIGEKNPVESASYIKLEGDPKIYITEADVQGAANTSLLDLRDKKLTDFSSDKVQEVDLQTKDLSLQFQKENGVWKMRKPVDSPASDSDVGSLVSSLEYLRATRFAGEPGVDYGFDKPAAVIDLRLEKGLQQKIIFGRKQGEEIYVKVEGSPEGAAVSDSFSTYFSKPLNDWREKKLIVFNRYDAEEFQVKAGGKEYRFKRGKEDNWSEEAPSRGTVDNDQLQSAMEKLETAEIARYGDKPDLGGPVSMEVFLTTKDWQDKTAKKHLAFGPVQQNQQAVKNDDYPTVVFVQADLQNEILKALDAIKPQPQSQKAVKK